MNSICPLCGGSIEENFNFCQNCGCRLVRCQSCNNLNVSTFKFCQTCGQELQFRIGSVTRQSITNERKRTPETRKNDSIDQKVYELLVSQKGKISWSNASKELDMSVEELKTSVNRLVEEGKISPQESNLQQTQKNKSEQSKDPSPRIQTISETRPQHRQNYPIRYQYNVVQDHPRTFGLSNLLEKLDGKRRMEKICAICMRTFRGTDEQILCLRCAILHPRGMRNH